MFKKIARIQVMGPNGNTSLISNSWEFPVIDERSYLSNRISKHISAPHSTLEVLIRDAIIQYAFGNSGYSCKPLDAKLIVDQVRKNCRTYGVSLQDANRGLRVEFETLALDKSISLVRHRRRIYVIVQPGYAAGLQSSLAMLRV